MLEDGFGNYTIELIDDANGRFKLNGHNLLVNSILSLSIHFAFPFSRPHKDLLHIVIPLIHVHSITKLNLESTSPWPFVTPSPIKPFVSQTFLSKLKMKMKHLTISLFLVNLPSIDNYAKDFFCLQHNQSRKMQRLVRLLVYSMQLMMISIKQ